MKTRLATVAVFVLVCFAGIWANAADAKDAKGCEGLGDYQKAMLKVGRAYLKELDKDGIPLDRDPTTFSTDEWALLAENALQFQRDIKDVTPPDWAKPWHQAQIEYAGLIEQFAKTAATSGLFAGLAFADKFEESRASIIKAVSDVSAVCADFAEFDRSWDALDGTNRDGTPVATPTP